MLAKLIVANVAVFVVVKLSMLAAMLCGVDAYAIERVLAMPAGWTMLGTRPWTALTYSWVHDGLFHIFFNMVCLYWIGRVFVTYNTVKQLVALYLLGGLGGAAAYAMATNWLPALVGTGGMLVGASACVLAVMVAAAVSAPNYRLSLFFYWSVPLKWLVPAMLLLDMLSMDDGNAGGHIAHLGGAVVGLIYAQALRQGVDITRWLNALFDTVASSLRRHPKDPERPVTGGKYHYSANKQNHTAEGGADDEAEVNNILEKIKQSGYTSLSDDEKRRLFEAGNRRR